MKQNLSRITMWLLFVVCSIYMQAATMVTLPSNSILFSNADLNNCKHEKEGANV